MADSEFIEAVEVWRKAADQLNIAEGVYARAYGAALADADGKSESIRAAQAELKVASERTTRDLARVREQAARWVVQYLLAKAGRDARAA